MEEERRPETNGGVDGRSDGVDGRNNNGDNAIVPSAAAAALPTVCFPGLLQVRAKI